MVIRKSDPHYEVICAFYGEQTARRSGVRYMNHIDEGLVILATLDASLDALWDQDMRRALGPESMLHAYGVELAPLALAVEYRVVANAYLSNRAVPSELEDILLSRLPEVNQMLIADKVQNRKDFEIHHKGKHESSRELDSYFRTWLKRLGVSEQRYRELASLADKA